MPGRDFGERVGAKLLAKVLAWAGAGVGAHVAGPGGAAAGYVLGREVAESITPRVLTALQRPSTGPDDSFAQAMGRLLGHAAANVVVQVARDYRSDGERTTASKLERLAERLPAFLAGTLGRGRLNRLPADDIQAILLAGLCGKSGDISAADWANVLREAAKTSTAVPDQDAVERTARRLAAEVAGAVQNLAADEKPSVLTTLFEGVVFERLDEIKGTLDAVYDVVVPESMAPREKVAPYLAHLRDAHSDLPHISHDSYEALEAVYFDLHIDPRETSPASGRDATDLPRSATLRELLEFDDPKTGNAPRWLVRGMAGTGKSTVARYVAWKLAQEDDGPVPVYVTLDRLARAGLRHPFAMAESDAGGGPGIGLRVAEGLRELAQSPQSVYLLLDGLDEVATASTRDLLTSISTWARTLEHVPIVVLTRPGAKGPKDTAHFLRADMRALSGEEQLAFLGKRFKNDEARAREVLEAVADRPLARVLDTPLMLTLLAEVVEGRDDGRVPLDRTELFDLAIDGIIRRSYAENGATDALPETTRRLLGEVALVLQRDGRRQWTQPELGEALRTALADPEIDAELSRDAAATWRPAEDFLDRLVRHDGVLWKHEGTNEPISFWHNTFREFLAAEALLRRGDDAALGHLADGGLARWGETLSFVCAGSDQPLEILHRLAALDDGREYVAAAVGEAAPRLADDVEETLDLLLRLEEQADWGASDDSVRRFVGGLGLDDGTRGRVQEALLRRVTATKDMTIAGIVYSVLESAVWTGDGGSHRQEFFERLGVELGGADLEWRSIPEGLFEMGSPDAEDGRDDDAGPQHAVTVRSFELAATPVTNEQYEAFDRGHEFEEGDGQHPVAGRSWWQAMLYCRWLGARLPSEAEWEYACRGLSDSTARSTRYWSGDDEADLARVGWYHGNSDGRLHAVGEKPANPFGLYDMHGNVFEWCEDMWHDSYEGAPTDGSAWVDEASEDRVVRGGSFDYSARFARSAYRSLGDPGNRNHDLGFRPARSVTAD